MKHLDKASLFIALALLLAAFALSGLLYARLPDPVPTHWGIHGEANGFTPKPWGAFLMPLIMTGLLALLAVLPAVSPQGFRMDRFAGVYRWLVVGMAALLFAIHGLTLSAALGRGPSLEIALPALLGLFFVLLGNWMPKVRRNFFVGVRTPWTLADEEVWNRTHRLAGKTMIAGGLAGTLLALLRVGPFWLPLLAILAGAILPAVASFFFWRSTLRARTVAFALLGLAALHSGPARAAGPPADPLDGKTDRLLVALRDGKPDEAEALFNAQMKAALPPESLAQAWTQVTAATGTLRSWSVAERTRVAGNEVRVVELVFASGHLRAVVAFDASGAISGLHFVPAPEPRPSAAATARTDGVRESEVSVGAAPTLPGTLLLPSRPGRLPAVVLVAGSGPQDRDETIGANRPFRDLAEGLARAGVASLRFDKRTFAHPESIDPKKVTVETEVIADAVAAVALLKSRPEIDPGKVFVVGHSLGAVLAPEIAGRSGAAGAALLAPSGRPLPVLIVEQLRYLGTPAAELAKTEKQAQDLLAGRLPPDGEFFHAPVSYFTDLDARDELALARGLKRPLLVLRGTRDYQVTEDDFQVWKKGLAGVPGASLEELEGLNHLMIHGEGKPGPEEYSRPSHVDPGVIARIVALVNPTAGP